MDHTHQLVHNITHPSPVRGSQSIEVGLILVVEDIPLIRWNAVSMFEDAGFAVLEAGNADEAVVLLADNVGVCLVFTDVSMPGTMDGLELAAFIRSRWPAMRLIVASGRTIIGEGQLPEGAKFFRKPYADAAVIAAARSLLM